MGIKALFYKGERIPFPGGSSTDEMVKQIATDSTDSDYEVLLSNTADNTTRTEGARKTQHIKFNPFSKLLKLTGHLYDKWGLQTSRTMYEADFNQLTQAEKDNGTNYYIPDGVGMSICDYIYPIGAIYMSINNISPALLFGGTWERIKDRFLLAAGDIYTVGSMDGEAEHILTEEEMPLHRHIQRKVVNNGGQATIINDTVAGTYSGDVLDSTKQFTWASNKAPVTTHEAGRDQPHNNMPPYLVVNVWMRVPDPVEGDNNGD